RNPMGTIGLVIAALAGVMIAVIGVLFLARPRTIAMTFGLPALPPEEATPWLRLKGIRDLTTGIVAGTLLLLAPPTVVGWILLAYAISIGLVIAALAGVMIAVIGVLFLARPRTIAMTFGLPALPPEEATPWLRLKGIRDLTTGIVAVTLLLLAPPTVVGWILLAYAI